MMKHNKEWHTCDRCGAEINMMPKSKFVEYLLHGRTPMEAKLEFDKGEITFGESEAGTAIAYVSTNVMRKSYDLCPKCRKDFERFMRNEG